MILLPAIDLYEKKAVRLFKGDYAQMTIYSEDPLAVARDFARCGARWIHMVDLEGARDGGTPNLEIVTGVAKETGLSVEVGGGIRDMETIERYIAGGVSRVILGTAAVQNEALLRQAVEAYGERIAVGADIRDGFIAIKGWLESSAWSFADFLARMQEIGVQMVICTDISRDGAMRGTNLELYGQLSKQYSMQIIASGGVSGMEDVRALKELGLYGAIIGKAYYTGALDLAKAIEVAR
ncbi:MAG: 1-(5-phosphoribosyl)-5-[Oscillospiraceae bacterium]|nr:1-(5-phosphoribosyl)-5-[(5-phosphoribosylamino)methylideneamino]imidazole-4-carboxamide isomerase [Oscillospiraceae bacterium]